MEILEPELYNVRNKISQDIVGEIVNKTERKSIEIFKLDKQITKFELQ